MRSSNACDSAYMINPANNQTPKTAVRIEPCEGHQQTEKQHRCACPAVVICSPVLRWNSYTLAAQTVSFLEEHRTSRRQQEVLCSSFYLQNASCSRSHCTITTGTVCVCGAQLVVKRLSAPAPRAHETQQPTITVDIQMEYSGASIRPSLQSMYLLGAPHHHLRWHQPLLQHHGRCLLLLQ